MLVHRHRLVWPQVFLENTDPLVLELQVSVLGIGHERIGRLRRCRPYPQKSPTQNQERFAVSTGHEKILDHEHE